MSRAQPKYSKGHAVVADSCQSCFPCSATGSPAPCQPRHLRDAPIICEAITDFVAQLFGTRLVQSVSSQVTGHSLASECASAGGWCHKRRSPAVPLHSSKFASKLNSVERSTHLAKSDCTTNPVAARCGGPRRCEAGSPPMHPARPQRHSALRRWRRRSWRWARRTAACGPWPPSCSPPPWSWGSRSTWWAPSPPWPSPRPWSRAPPSSRS